MPTNCPYVDLVIPVYVGSLQKDFDLAQVTIIAIQIKSTEQAYTVHSVLGDRGSHPCLSLQVTMESIVEHAGAPGGPLKESDERNEAPEDPMECITSHADSEDTM